MHRIRVIDVSRMMGVLLLLFGFFFLPTIGSADAFMYMDESGNIHFAERVSHVPEEYREQVVKPTPMDLDKKEYKKMLSEQKKQREAAKKKKAKEEAKKQKKALRMKKKQLKLLKKQQKRAERDEKKAEKF